MSALTPLRIEIKSHGSESYKSIRDLVWDDVPPFVILTGVNGSGKTQLLESLAWKLTGSTHPQSQELNRLNVSVTPETFGPESVLYLPSAWDMQSMPSLGVAQISQLKQQLWQELRQHNAHPSPGQRAKYGRVSKAIGQDVRALTLEQFSEVLPNDYAFMLEDEDIVTGLAHVIVAHKLRMADEVLRGTKIEDVHKKLGKPPWDLVNEALSAAEFSYRLVSPLGTNLDSTYHFKLKNPVSGVEITPADLSSGEKAILRTLLWLVRGSHQGKFAKLYLLDEPDAHLHPSMTVQFLNVMKDVLVGRHGIRVILATHSPSTVALAPEGSVFEMYKDQPRIRPSLSIAHSVGLLTAGLVVVSRGTRFVFVEDQDDVDFYTKLWDVLTHPSANSSVGLLDRTPSLVFLAASVGKGAKRSTGGGSSVVPQWIQKFDDPPLDEMFRGLIDRDAGNTGGPRLYVISRYSFENYLLDPLIVYGLLVEMGTAPTVTGVEVAQGDEHLIRDLSEQQLQNIVDMVCAQLIVSENPTALDLAIKQVEFVNGKKLQYPAWVIDSRGHNFWQMFQQVFGTRVTPPNLLRMMQRVRLVPIELLQIMKQLQA